MLFNSFEHGYQDGRRGREPRSACQDYVDGYKRAVKQLQEDRSMTLWVAGFIFLMLGAVFCVTLASAMPAGPV